MPGLRTAPALRDTLSARRFLAMPRSLAHHPQWPLAALALLLLGLLGGCGAYMKLDGAIQRVRLVETGGPRNVLVVEFRATNNAKIGYVVREAEVEITLNDQTVTGDIIAVRDAQTMCQHMASLDGDCAEALLTRQTIGPGETVRRLVAASFNLRADELRDRTQLTLRVRELDRLETVLLETPPTR
jgi:hypothetical protein